MAWTGQTFTVGQILTAAQMNNLQADITAAFNKDAGAPVLANSYIVTAMYSSGSVDQAAVGNSAIGQGELKSTTASQSASVSASGRNTISLSGGTYTMGWFIGSQASNNYNQKFEAHNSTYATQVTIYNATTNTYAMYVYSRYVQGSPPYNLGDGDIPLFVYALIENGTGKVLGTSVAVDPHWSYNSGLLIYPHRTDRKTGKQYRGVPKFILDSFKAGVQPKKLLTTVDAATRERILDPTSPEREVIEVEITKDFKNLGMKFAPHPFMHEDLTNKTVVLLDPVSPMALQLYDIHKMKERGTFDDDVSELLNNDYIRIDNTPLARANPNGVISVAPRWKLTA